jgi:hypothetical protein
LFAAIYQIALRKFGCAHHEFGRLFAAIYQIALRYGRFRRGLVFEDEAAVGAGFGGLADGFIAVGAGEFEFGAAGGAGYVVF